jgi:hypothetical protein
MQHAKAEVRIVRRVGGKEAHGARVRSPNLDGGGGREDAVALFARTLG